LKPSGRFLLTFFAGSVIGAVVALAAAGRHWNRTFEDMSVSGLAGQAYVAREIYAGRSNVVADLIRQSLPESVAAIEREFRSGQGRAWAYWLVSDVYQVSGAPVPGELRAILSSLPPRSSCRQPKRIRGGASEF